MPLETLVDSHEILSAFMLFESARESTRSQRIGGLLNRVSCPSLLSVFLVGLFGLDG